MLIKSIVDNRRANRFEKYPVKILLSDKGNRKYISLRIYADLIEFDEASGLLITSNKNLDFKVSRVRVTASVLKKKEGLEFTVSDAGRIDDVVVTRLK